MSNILIIGKGVVGSNLYAELESLHPDVVDKYHPERNIKAYDHYDIAFICVDTPKTENDVCDTTEVEVAMQENRAELYVIKSTVKPRTTQRLVEATGKRVIFSPEYYGGTQHCNNFEFNFTVLAGKREWCHEVQQVLQKIYDARHKFKITDSTTAEIAKYMENSWLATKVSFCCQFYDICKNEGLDYDELREIFILDPRVNPSHTFVYDEKPYWDSHCLNKDVPTIAEAENAELLKAIIDFNMKRRK